MKYNILIDFGGTGYNVQGGSFRLWRLLKTELKKGAVIQVIELAAMSRKPNKTSKSAKSGRNKNT